MNCLHMKIKYIWIIILLVSACKKTTPPEVIPPDPVLKSIATDVSQVVVPRTGTVALPFHVEDAGAALNYSAQSADCQIELRISGSTEKPVNYIIEQITKTEKAGTYNAYLKDSGRRILYKENIILCLITSRSGSNKTMVTSQPVEVMSTASMEGIQRFTFTKDLNPSLKYDVVMDALPGENEAGQILTGNTPNPLNSLNLIARFETSGTVTINGQVQQSGVTVNDFSAPVEYNISASDGTSLTYTVKLTNFTGLPVVFINTQNGTEITSKEIWTPGTMSIMCSGAFEDFPESEIEIRGRGNTTWYWPKKPYAIKLGSKARIMGMPKHKRWVLLANFMDRTMLRNRIAYKAAQQTSLAWTPRNEIVELVFNGKHLGNYMFIEQIKEDENRVNVSKDGGYILELDFHFDNPAHVQWLSPYGNTAQFGNNIPFAVKFPEDDEVTTEQMDWIKNYIDQAGNAIYGTAYLDPENGYKKYIDMTSFVDYWLIYELCVNHELANPGSVYMYKDKDTKLFAGPCWDFDWGTFSYNASPQARGKLFMTEAIWYKQFFKDPAFRALAKERWNAVKSRMMELPAFLDSEAGKLTLSARYNFSMWNPADDRSMNNGNIINGDENLSYEDAVQRMRTILVERLSTLDTEINKW